MIKQLKIKSDILVKLDTNKKVSEDQLAAAILGIEQHLNGQLPVGWIEDGIKYRAHLRFHFKVREVK